MKANSLSSVGIYSLALAALGQSANLRFFRLMFFSSIRSAFTSGLVPATILLANASLGVSAAQVTMGNTTVTGRTQSFSGVGVDFFGGTLATSLLCLRLNSVLLHRSRSALCRTTSWRATFRTSCACHHYQRIGIRRDAIRTSMRTDQRESSNSTSIQCAFFFTVQATGSSEDCLTLNIFRPTGTNTSSALPVMVWIYGGGFQEGESSTYNATEIIIRSVERVRFARSRSPKYR